MDNQVIMESSELVVYSGTGDASCGLRLLNIYFDDTLQRIIASFD